MRTLIPVAVTGLMVGQAQAADLAVRIEIPRLNVAEYHRPYVAVWVEGPDQKVAANLAVWYDVKLKNDEGTKWLKDMRQWWRRTGRELTMPADGISGATRPVGEHQLAFSDGKAPLGKLAEGKYELVVEAAREVGGRELLRIPFQWPPRAPEKGEARGQHELGRVALETKP
ncbi:DUF2271 domain-containing protein [Pigmentiphaga sp. GD03639]|uniref:DUF2271 domain-containing protein n=1 Tax=Pigmentiphaga daeguensis TaxID=414049 RepID=A0ABP3LI62_9BURK|nr:MULTISPECIES: DUF2271 domain-containing protein [unclassified Pigmentiphaga]MDH2234914.1 DUF2271 domain-containing protein [Pigmentiphaga sp. GD03639]OVZ62501.1 hypothetical protein CDO46_14835 [Pigmentiphaga sp. NML030171]